mmetsp:Transcript_13599/g.34821  ORF Transcript_13599/g.34821 Transcript_13599/m.34821 type:complete len:345 (+) Transcript_13599:161-1195(+)
MAKIDPEFPRLRLLLVQPFLHQRRQHLVPGTRCPAHGHWGPGRGREGHRLVGRRTPSPGPPGQPHTVGSRRATAPFPPVHLGISRRCPCAIPRHPGAAVPAAAVAGGFRDGYVQHGGLRHIVCHLHLFRSLLPRRIALVAPPSLQAVRPRRMLGMFQGPEEPAERGLQAGLRHSGSCLQCVHGRFRDLQLPAGNKLHGQGGQQEHAPQEADAGGGGKPRFQHGRWPTPQLRGLTGRRAPGGCRHAAERPLDAGALGLLWQQPQAAREPRQQHPAELQPQGGRLKGRRHDRVCWRLRQWWDDAAAHVRLQRDLGRERCPRPESGAHEARGSRPGRGGTGRGAAEA